MEKLRTSAAAAERIPAIEAINVVARNKILSSLKDMTVEENKNKYSFAVIQTNLWDILSLQKRNKRSPFATTSRLAPISANTAIHIVAP